MWRWWTSQLAPAEPVAGEPAEVICTVFNCIAAAARGNRPAGAGRLHPGTARHGARLWHTAEAVFNVTFAAAGPGDGQGCVAAPDDLREDNTRYVAVQVHKALQVLLVSDADAGDARSAAFFVSRALAPSPGRLPGLQVVRRHSQDTDRGILETADVFLLVAPAS